MLLHLHEDLGDQHVRDQLMIPLSGLQLGWHQWVMGWAKARKFISAPIPDNVPPMRHGPWEIVLHELTIINNIHQDDCLKFSLQPFLVTSIFPRDGLIRATIVCFAGQMLN
jgi:hypothetical protein